MTSPGTRDRYAQCDNTCTVDCGACKGAGRPAPSPDAEPPHDLREQIAEALHCAAEDPEDAYPVAWEDNYARNDLYDAADALLSGPLAPLLAKLRAVEALVAFYDRHEYTTLVVDDIRRAIAEEAS